MSLKTIRTPDGQQWDVWDVIPAGAKPVHGAGEHTAERRAPEPVLRYAGVERRQRGPTVRASQGAVTPPALAGGWLVFSSGSVKKRLAPFPADWDTLSEQKLVELLKNAR